MENRYQTTPVNQKSSLVAPLANLIKYEIENEIKSKISELDTIFVKKSELYPFKARIPRSISDVQRGLPDLKLQRNTELINSLAKLKVSKTKLRNPEYDQPKISSDELIKRFHELEIRIKAVLQILEPSLYKQQILLNDECTKLKTYLDTNGFNNIKNDILYINNIIEKYMKNAAKPIVFEGAANQINNRLVNFSKKKYNPNDVHFYAKHKEVPPTKEIKSILKNNKINVKNLNGKCLKKTSDVPGGNYISDDVKGIINDIISNSNKTSTSSSINDKDPKDKDPKDRDPKEKDPKDKDPKDKDPKKNYFDKYSSVDSSNVGVNPSVNPLESLSLNLDVGLNDNSSDFDLKQNIGVGNEKNATKTKNDVESNELNTTEELNIYDEIYYQRRQNRLNFLTFKKSDRTINLNCRPLNVQFTLKPINPNHTQYVKHKEKIAFGCPAIFSDHNNNQQKLE